MPSEAQKRATKKYVETHIVRFLVRVNRETEPDILERLESVPRKNAYIKGLIRKDIREHPDIEEGGEITRQNDQ